MRKRAPYYGLWVHLPLKSNPVGGGRFRLTFGIALDLFEQGFEVEQCLQ